MDIENVELSDLEAPYSIYKEKDRECFYFKVNATKYTVAFLSSTPLDGLPLDSICITRDLKDYNGNKDVAQTIISIIINLLDKDRVLCFTCDTDDGRQFARQRLFKNWFNRNPISFQYKLLIIENAGDVCGGVIIKRNHPLFSQYTKMLDEFKEQMKEDKPDIIIE